MIKQEMLVVKINGHYYAQIGKYVRKMRKVKQLIDTARATGAKDAYTMFLKIIQESKLKFPNSKEFEIIVDVRDIEKSITYLKGKTK